MASAEMTGLSFDIETTGSVKAINQLNKLSKALVNLSNTVNNSNGAFDKLAGMATAISKLNGVKISPTIAKQLQGIADSLHSFSNNDVRRLQKISEALGGIGYASSMSKGLNESITNVSGNSQEVLQSVPIEIEDNGATQQEEARISTFDKIANVSKIAAASVKTFGSASLKAGVQFGQLATKLGLNPFARLSNSIKGAVGGMSQFLSSIKRIMMYRAIRFLISQVTQGLKEGISNLYQYSKAVNGAFAESMDRISTSLQYLKNSIGAAVAPLLNALAPAIDVLVDKVVTFINAINQVIASLTGSSTYTVAKKVSKEYASAAGSAKEIQKSLMGFDEINRLNSENGSGSSGSNADYGSMFTEQAISNNIKDFTDKIKKYINQQDWEGLGNLLGEKINKLFPDNDWWERQGEKFGTGVNGIAQTTYYTIKKIDFEKLGSDVGSWINGAFSKVDFSFIGRMIVQPITKLFDFFYGALKTVDWVKVGKSIGDFFVGAMDEFSDFLESHNWFEVVDSLQKAITGIIKGVDKKAVAESLLRLLKAALTTAIQLLIATSPLYTLYQGLKKQWNKKVKEDPLSLEAKIQNRVSEWWNNVKNWWGNRQLNTTLNVKTPKTVSVDTIASTAKKLLFGFSVKWNAKGGILNGAQLFGAAGNTLLGGGEAGREAVLPLDSHTEWMSDIADRVVSYLGNNNGLAQAIGSEVYNAMVAGNTDRPLNITVVSQIDKTAVGKASVEYHNGVVTQTGMSPLTI